MMSDDLTKRAAEMLLKGATLLAAPCPYCKGVRVMKDGTALCISCGREPKSDESSIEKKSESPEKPSQQDSTLQILEKKLESLTKDLEKEADYEKQQQILKSINSLVEIIAKLRS
jgi:UPF0148 protein